MIGSIFVVIALLASIYSLYQYYKNFRGKNTIQKARIGFHIMSISVIGASVVLLYLILNHQFQYDYVFSYSSTKLSFGLLLSTFFAGQEGSFLLWALFSVIIGLILLTKYQKTEEKETSLMLGYIPTVSFILVMISPLLKNPFAYLWSTPSYIDTKYLNSAIVNSPLLKNQLLTDANNNTFVKFGEEFLRMLENNGIHVNQFIMQGKGLNPMLENFWMQIHPPILFLGFVLAAVPFAFVISSLLKNEYKKWIDNSLPWVIATTLVLGLGIMIGGYWAYGVLGWGGYWAWDPVENSSLVPWIVCTALLHTMIIQKRAQAENKPGSVTRLNLFLAGIMFVLVVYSTFLTRSGILSETSVHSFTDPGTLIYTVLFGFLIFFTGTVIGLIYYRKDKIKPPVKNGYKLLSRETGLLYGSVLLIASAFAILVGTSAPIFGQTVEIKFYNQVNLPLVILMNLLIPLTLYLNWTSNNKNLFLKRIAVSFVISAAVTIVLTLLIKEASVLYVLLVFASAFTIVTNLEFIITSNKNLKLLGGHITHIGFAIFLLGVLLSAILSFGKEIRLEKGKNYSFANSKIIFDGYIPIEGGKKYSFDVKVQNGSDVETANPVMYVSDYNNSVMREPYIITGFTKDIYIEPISFESGTPVNSDIVTLKKGKPVNIDNTVITFEQLKLPEDAMKKMLNNEKFTVTATIKLNKDNYSNTLDVDIAQGTTTNVKDDKANISFDILNFDVSGILRIKLNDNVQYKSMSNDVLTINISEKPFISLVWIGVLVMALGLIIVYIRRTSENN